MHICSLYYNDEGVSRPKGFLIKELFPCHSISSSFHILLLQETKAQTSTSCHDVLSDISYSCNNLHNYLGNDVIIMESSPVKLEAGSRGLCSILHKNLHPVYMNNDYPLNILRCNILLNSVYTEIINVYIPICTHVLLRASVLHSLFSLLASNVDNKVTMIVAGDFNTHPESLSLMLINSRLHHALLIVPAPPLAYSFESIGNRSRTLIDYFIISRNSNFFNPALTIETNAPRLLSDHKALN